MSHQPCIKTVNILLSRLRKHSLTKSFRRTLVKKQRRNSTIKKHKRDYSCSPLGNKLVGVVDADGIVFPHLSADDEV